MMTHFTCRNLLISAFVVLFAIHTSGACEPSFSLTYLDRHNIANEGMELDEPSGLALSHGKNALWTVSDGTKRIFKLALNGDLKEDESFKVPEDKLEGITLTPDGEFLLAIREDDNKIIKIKIDTQAVIASKRLADMAGFDAIATHLAGGGANKGLEGITWNENTGTIFVMKEGVPGILVEVSSDMQTILAHKLLNDHNGFLDDKVRGDELDFSGICYDSVRSRFWIVSDKAKRLYLYDWNENKVIQSATLGYRKDGQYREIEKAEGVAIDPDTNRLYVVSDEEAQLYVFDIRE